MSVDVVQSVVLQIEVISVSLCPLLLKKNQGLSHGFIIIFFPTLMPTQVAFIFMLLSPGKRESEGESEGEREGRVWISFFPPLFLHLSLNKNTLNPF